MKEPKVLVVSNNPFSDTNNNGKTLKSIFSSFSSESLFQFYIMPQENEMCDSSYASSYYAVSEFDIIRKLLFQSKKCGGIQSFEGEKIVSVSQNGWYRRLKQSRIRNIHFLRQLLWKTGLWDTKQLKEWYSAISPDLVFALVGAPDITYKVAIKICQDLNIPLVIYFTDDYFIHPIRKGLFKKQQINKEKKVYENIINFASLRYCIGEMMCKEYSDYFHRDFLPIMNLADIRPVSDYKTHDLPVVSYFGSLSLNRWKMLERFSSLLGNRGVIHVYTGDAVSGQIAESLNKNNIKLCGLVKGEEFEQKKAQSDILLHVESDEREQRARTALSISTKIPDYLMTGRLIIGYGPTEVASMRLISDNGVGVVLSSTDEEEKQQKILTELLANKEKWKEFGEKAYQFAKEKFDKTKNSLAIKSQLSQIVKGTNE